MTQREGWEHEKLPFLVRYTVVRCRRAWKKKRREARTTLAAGVFEAGDRRRDCGLSSPITSTHLLPYLAMSCFSCMPCKQHPAASGTPSSTHPLLTLPDYSAAVSQYSQALGTGTPLELLLTVCSFTGTVCAHGSHII